MTAKEYIKDKFTGKSIIIYDRKTMKDERNRISILDINTEKRSVRFMEEGGDPEWDILLGSFYISVDKKEGIIEFDISEANWDIQIFVSYQTGEYCAVMW